MGRRHRARAHFLRTVIVQVLHRSSRAKAGTQPFIVNSLVRIPAFAGMSG